MTVHSLETQLADSHAFNALVGMTGVEPSVVRRLLAALGNLPAEQVVRMCGMAADGRVRQVNRATRKAER